MARSVGPVPGCGKHPGKVSGAWVLQAHALWRCFESLEDGMTIDEVGAVPCYAGAGQGRAEFAARSLDAPVPGR
jgi:hypothetical protein